MRKLNKPNFSVLDVYDLCNSKMDNEDLKARLDECIPSITQAAKQYDSLATKTLLHTFEDDLCNDRSVSIKDMKKVYSDRMVDGPGRTVYDKIKSAAPSQTCPYCGQRKVSTLDHFLPKSKYPSFVVTPNNLVPSCGDCNKGKSHAVSDSIETTTLHPYFDDVEFDRFLFARIIIDRPPVIDFYVKPPVNWDSVTAKRVKHHFDAYDLNVLYRSHAPDEITGQIEVWNELSPRNLKEELQKHARSRIRKFPNSWQAALYECLSESDWFCEGGYHWFDDVTY